MVKPEGVEREKIVQKDPNWRIVLYCGYLFVDHLCVVNASGKVEWWEAMDSQEIVRQEKRCGACRDIVPEDTLVLARLMAM